MGKIYSYEEIKSGKVPSPRDFSVAKELVFDRLSTLVRNKDVSGAKIFGSVGKGTPNERSDFDLLVITERDDAIQELKEGINEIYVATNVAVEPIVIARPLAERGFHTIDASFSQHLQRTDPEGNTIGIDPLELMKPSDLPLTVVHQQYLTQKLRRLREGVFSRTSEDENRVLQRALEAPINTRRRTLQVLAHMGILRNLQNDDGKSAVINDFNNTFDGTPLVSRFNYLIDKDIAYTTLLRETLSGTVNQKEYEDAVHTMALETIPPAIYWVSEVSMIYSQLLEGARVSQEGVPFRPGNKERF
jgi:predicted nucleotidyltransferase